MWQEIIRKWNCRRFAPLLTAYAEGELDAARRGPVENHLESCDDCQEQIALFAETGDLLRAHPPAVPELSADLWARIRSEIDAEPAPTPAAPQRQPVRNAPVGSAWRNFGMAFAGSGALVAAGVVGVVLVTQPVMRQERETRQAAERALVANAGTPDAGITIELRDSAPKVPPARVVKAAAPTAPAVERTLVVKAARTETMNRPMRRSRPRRFTTLASASPRPSAEIAVNVAPEPLVQPARRTKPVDAPVEAEANATGGMSLPPGSVAVAEVSVAPRDVPAPRSVADVAVKMRSQQVLFTYTGR